MVHQVKLNKTALLRENNQLLARENELLREKFEREQQRANHYEEAVQEQECPSCDLKALRDKRCYLEDRIEREKKLNLRIRDKGGKVYNGASCSGKMNLLCALQAFQLQKVCMAEAELADVVKQIWECQTLNSEDRLCALLDKVNCELEKCEDQVVDYFVADAVKDVMKETLALRLKPIAT